ncbi:DNA-directed RNA polymerase subunit omega [bacterium HR11]|nr:DNA-directed RNA polymerase subunit omega [bacterium HR11]
MESLHVFYEDVENMYMFITLAAQRVDQLYRGARPRVKPLTPDEKPTVLAMREVLAGKVRYETPPSLPRPIMKEQSMNVSFM